jgi:inner membrane protein
MTGMTHATIGLSEAMAIALLSPNVPPVLLGALVVGSVLPDIDVAGSFISNRTKINLSFLGHRKILHSLIGALLLSLPFLLLKNYIGVFSVYLTAGLFLGCITHLVLDSFTLSGITWFYPFSKKKLRGRIRTGSLGDTAFLVFGVISIFVFVQFLSGSKLALLFTHFLK